MGTNDATTVARLKALYEINDALAALPIHAMKHIESSSQEEMSTQEKTLAELQDTIQQGLTIASGSDSPSQVDARAALSEIKTTLTQLTGLSRLDTNNRSASMSLTESRTAADEFGKRLEALDKFLAEEAQAGRAMSESVYSNAVWWILGVMLSGIVIGGVIAYIITQSVTRPVAEVRNLAQSMAGGDLRQRVQLQQSDEVGELVAFTSIPMIRPSGCSSTRSTSAPLRSRKWCSIRAMSARHKT